MFQSFVTETVRQKLEALRDHIQTDSLTEVIRRDSAVYDFRRAEKAKGNALVGKDPEGGEKEVLLL